MKRHEGTLKSKETICKDYILKRQKYGESEKIRGCPGLGVEGCRGMMNRHRQFLG